MFEHNSRYYNHPTATYLQTNGKAANRKEVAYVRRRFLPPLNSLTPVLDVTVTAGDRIDLITAKNLGDPQQFWRICDANPILDPSALTAEVGRTITLAAPQI